MSQTVRIDANAAGEFLRGRFGEIDGVSAFTRGEWSSAYAFSHGGRPLVARFGAWAEDYEKDRAAAAWSTAALPIPSVLEIGEAFGGAYVISERRFGAPLDELNTAGWRDALPALFDALAALRSIEPPGNGFGDWRPDGRCEAPSWRDWLLCVGEDAPGRRVHGWRSRLAAVPGAERRFGVAYRALQSAVAAVPDDLRCAVHADLTAGNVLVDHDRITAVLDWGCSIAGDPLYDIGWLTFWEPWHPGMDAGAIRAHARDRFGDTRFDERVRCYALRVGLDAHQFSAWAQRPEELDMVSARTLMFAG